MCTLLDDLTIFHNMKIFDIWTGRCMPTERKAEDEKLLTGLYDRRYSSLIQQDIIDISHQLKLGMHNADVLEKRQINAGSN